MTDYDAERIATFETNRWEQEGWERGREKYVAKLKGTLSGLTKKRIETFKWAEQMVEEVKRAHLELGLEAGDTLGGTRLAKQLTAQGVLTRRGVKPSQLADAGKAWADALISETDSVLIDEAVMECRTLMTARCLSADFEASELGGLEAEYVEIIADILALGRRLRNSSPIPRHKLLARAKIEAEEVAKRQRRDKPPITMTARERYWRDRPAPIRKVFETKYP